MASRWQTFAYPLPGLRRYLLELGQRHGAPAALEAVRELRISTLQTGPTAGAVRDLACDAELGLAFSAIAARATNWATLLKLALDSRFAASLAVIAGAPGEATPRERVELDLGSLPKERRFFGVSRAGQRRAAIDHERGQNLGERLGFVTAHLEGIASADANAYRRWLDAVRFHIELTNLAEYRPSVPPAAAPAMHDGEIPPPSWLEPAWSLLSRIEEILVGLEDYRIATSAAARRELLGALATRLRRCSMEGLPWLWSGVGMELIEHWVRLVEGEAERAREWLNLEITLVDSAHRTGRGELRFAAVNPTGVVAQHVTVTVENTRGVHFGTTTLSERQLEGGKRVELALPLTFETPGEVRINGELSARDLTGAPFRRAFSFRVAVSKPGKPYQYLPLSTYPAGPGVDRDDVFSGRRDVLAWLGSLWATPNKAAALLIGQRRIGKSSILNRITRRGLGVDHLAYALVDVQGTQGAGSFLHAAADAVARAAGVAVPELGTSEPGTAFMSWARELGRRMNGKRVLLMLDEADWLETRVGSGVLGLLRSLMQQPEYPLVLLFAGTHALRRMGRDYQSILFNTTSNRPVSYMSPDESAEVLTKPVGAALEFDRAALREAHRLTAGQPFLLHRLAGTVLQQRNERLERGERPDNFIDLQSIASAADAVTRDDNPAYQNHWDDRSAAERRVLAACAAVPERIRVGHTFPELLRELERLDLRLSGEALAAALDVLTGEEFLLFDDGRYRFHAPLFQRWIAFKYRPELVREVTRDARGKNV